MNRLADIVARIEDLCHCLACLDKSICALEDSGRDIYLQRHLEGLAETTMDELYNLRAERDAIRCAA